MRTYHPAQPIIGLHIPKCAGTSLMRVLRGWFGRQVHWHYFDEVHNRMPKRYVPTPWRRLLHRLTGRNVCIYGHFNRARGFGVEAYYPDVDQFFAIVRHPLQITLSRYFAAKLQGEQRVRGGQRAPITARYTTLDAFFADQINRPYLVNYLPGTLTLDNYIEILETRFVYLGVSEDLQVSVDQLAARLGFAGGPVPQINVSKYDETLDPALATKFERSRPLEYAIYHYALEHYRDSR